MAFEEAFRAGKFPTRNAEKNRDRRRRVTYIEGKRSSPPNRSVLAAQSNYRGSWPVSRAALKENDYSPQSCITRSRSAERGRATPPSTRGKRCVKAERDLVH